MALLGVMDDDHGADAKHHHTIEELQLLSRRRIQTLAKTMGIKANQKTSDIIDEIVGSQQLLRQATLDNESAAVDMSSSIAEEQIDEAYLNISNRKVNSSLIINDSDANSRSIINDSIDDSTPIDIGFEDGEPAISLPASSDPSEAPADESATLDPALDSAPIAAVTAEVPTADLGEPIIDSPSGPAPSAAEATSTVTNSPAGEPVAFSNKEAQESVSVIEENPSGQSASEAAVVLPSYQAALATYQNISSSSTPLLFTPQPSTRRSTSIKEASRSTGRPSAKKVLFAEPKSTGQATPRPKFDLQSSLSRPVTWEMKRGPLPPPEGSSTTKESHIQMVFSPDRRAERQQQFKSNRFGGTDQRRADYMQDGQSKTLTAIAERRNRLDARADQKRC